MFSFLKPKPATTDADTSTSAPVDGAADTMAGVSSTPASDQSPAQAAAKASADVPAPLANDNPLAALVWDAPDVPTPGSGPSGSASHGLDVGALVAPPAATPAPKFGETDAARTEAIKPGVIAAISTIYDPEIPVNIYELGLIYDIVSDAEGRVTVTMTLTSPACPSAQQLPAEAHFKTKAVDGVTDAYVDVVWEPPWSKELMSETAKMALGMF